MDSYPFTTASPYLRPDTRQPASSMETDDSVAQPMSRTRGDLSDDVSRSTERSQSANIRLIHTRKLMDILHSLTELEPEIQKEIKEVESGTARGSSETNNKHEEQHIQNLEEENAHLQRKLTESQLNVSSFENNNTNLKQKLEKTKRENKQLDNNMRTLKEQVDKIVDEIQRDLELKKDEVEKLKRLNENLASHLKNERKQKEAIKEQLDERDEALQRARRELDETKSRLSMVIGTKMKTDNSNIADLSDKNRPTKLAEAFNELYDNEWTDAFETLQNNWRGSGDKDKGCIRHLYDTLMEIYRFCKKEADSQTEQLKKCLLIKNQYNSEISETNLHQLKEFQRSNAECGAGAVCEKYKLRHSSRYQIPEFEEQCVHICWLMVCQNPPMAFFDESQSTVEFNRDEYKAYTNTGKSIDYVVWPQLLLHEGGPRLAKGVAQCIAPEEKRFDSANVNNTDDRYCKRSSQANISRLDEKEDSRYGLATYSQTSLSAGTGGGKDSVTQHETLTDATDRQANISPENKQYRRESDEIRQSFSSGANEHRSLSNNEQQRVSKRGSEIDRQRIPTQTSAQVASTDIDYPYLPQYYKGYYYN